MESIGKDILPSAQKKQAQAKTPGPAMFSFCARILWVHNEVHAVDVVVGV